MKNHLHFTSVKEMCVGKRLPTLTTLNTKFKGVLAVIVFLAGLVGLGQTAFSQSALIPAGSFIINMGVLPQTPANGVKPYGMIYDIVKNYQGAVVWSINPAKAKDGTDFTYAGVDYKGGTFIITTPYRTTAINGRITYWQGQGVVGVTTTAPLTVPYFSTLKNMPQWTLDKQNGAIALNFFNYAGIPSTAYGGSSSTGWKTPAQLNSCDDLFIMPHADPTWATHSNLYDWNLTYKGGIWLGCHAGSALEDMFNPASPTQQTNFLSNKIGTATGIGPYCENALVLWGNHADGTIPYNYAYPTDPIMQFMGNMDAALLNGSEKIYMPVLGGGWRTGAKVYVWDPTQANVPTKSLGPAAVLISGKAFDDVNRGRVMIEASHNISGTGTANVAAMRAFFNFSYYATGEKAVAAALTISPITSPMNPGTAYPLSFTFSGAPSNYNILWQASMAGTFTPNATSQNATFTPGTITGPTQCIISVTLTDKSCPSKTLSDNQTVQITCGLQLTSAISPACNGVSSGSISMTNITGGAAPYNWSWTRAEGGSGSGTGTSITGLATGTYTVTVTANGGTGCSKSFTAILTENPAIIATATGTNLICNNIPTGSINLAVSGGTPGYTYNWGNSITSQNRTSIAAGSYTVTVTDSKGCTKTASATLTQPNAMVITPTISNIICNGNTTGAISLGVAGGNGSYTYVWNNGNTSPGLTDVAAGTYAVTVTDASFCSQSLTGISITQPDEISVSASAGTIACNGNTTSLTVTASGGNGTLLYSINGVDFQASNTFTVAASSSAYIVSVKDASNCIKTTNILVTQPETLTLSTAVNNCTCPGASNGSITLTVSGGTGPFNYDWADVSGTNNSKNRTALASGTYNVLVTDSHSCPANTSATVINTSSTPVQPALIIH